MMRSMNPSPLDVSHIVASLTPMSAPLLSVAVRDSVGSTNDVVRERGQDGSFHGAAVLAEEQTQGRGRRGRTWHSPAGANLYCSLGWSFEQPLQTLSGLSLAIGAMIAETVETDYGAELALKWPNDLFHDDRKLGGILVEMVGEDSGRQRVIMGIGLNVDMPMGEGDVISRPWTDLRTVIGAPIDRNELAGRLLSQLAEGLTAVDRYGMGEWLQRWRRWDYLKGRSVVVDGVPPVTGIAAGIDDGGALLVNTASGQSVVAGGEASLLQIGGAP